MEGANLEPPVLSSVLTLAGITKRFGALVANDAVSLELARGEVLALLGENGAGKSTLVSILFGHYVADAGTIEAFGSPLPPGDPEAALAAGIGMVHQHFTLADNLTVLDNIVIGTEPLWQPFSRRRAAAQAGAETAARFGLAVNTGRAGGRALGRRAAAGRDPEGALPRRAHPDPGRAHGGAHAAGEPGPVRDAAADGDRRAVDHLHQPQARRGAGVSDRIAVLRDGRLVALREARGATKAELALLMVGRAVVMPTRERRAAGDRRRRLRGVHVRTPPAARLLDGID